MDVPTVKRRLRGAAAWAVGWVRSRSRRELYLLAGLLIAVLGIWFFVELADEVVEGDTDRLDRWVVQSLRRPDDPAKTIGPELLAEVALEITALGSNAVLTLLTGAVLGYLWLRGKRHAMWLVIGSVAGGAIASTLLKLGFDRPRPDLVPHLTPIRSSSFPSGHSMLAAVVWITLGALLASLEESRRLKAYVLSLALVVTLLVGLTRVFLGVHYPTDVLAGWCAGLSWAMLCWVASKWLQRRGTVESEEPDVRAPVS